MNAIAPSGTENSQDRAYHFIKDRMLLLDLKPNDHIRAQDIATCLKLSRTPVREALSRLEQEGLVRRDEGWGYIVRAVSFKEALDVYKVREALEAEAAKEAITRVDDKHLRDLRGILDRSEAALSRGRLDQFRSHNKSFHKRIASIANNSYLIGMLAAIEDRVRLLGAMIFDRHVDRTADVVKENRAIYTALQSRDPVAAERAVRDHVRRSWEAFTQYVMSESAEVHLQR